MQKPVAAAVCRTVLEGTAAAAEKVPEPVAAAVAAAAEVAAG